MAVATVDEAMAPPFALSSYLRRQNVFASIKSSFWPPIGIKCKGLVTANLLLSNDHFPAGRRFFPTESIGYVVRPSELVHQHHAIVGFLSGSIRRRHFQSICKLRRGLIKEEQPRPTHTATQPRALRGDAVG